MSAGGYEAFFQSPAFGPGWMHKTWGQAFWRSVGRVLDQQNDLLRQAQAVRNPDGALAQSRSDALDTKGDDLLLARGGTTPGGTEETDSAYAARLLDPWDTWGQDPVAGAGAGSVKGIFQQLKIAGFPVDVVTPGSSGAVIVNYIGQVYQFSGGEIVTGNTTANCVNRVNLDGTVGSVGFTLDAHDQIYSHFCILFLQDVPSLTNDAGNTVKARLNTICRQWKSASAIYNGAAVLPSGAKVWGWPIGTKWGDGGLVWGSNGARFIDPE